MILIGMFDSPFVRRVAVALDRLGLSFEHRDWSVGRDFDRIREYSPLGRVPVLVLDDGEVLTESAVILDWLDGQAGAQALLPAHGAERRQALRLVGYANGAVEKALQQVMERVFRPEEKRHAPWVGRCRTQMEGALQVLDRACADAAGREWLVGEHFGLADLTLACFCTYLRDALPYDLDRFPALAARVARYEALPVLRKYYVPFDAPTGATA
ncbi:glutathione S-transferase family protein [Stenotrophomonas sp. HITSZ_GD]|uniref:glutathione S-transferase family protein n=1 Tax=Stenotrophomonas sp. HITSZ_GD TaxID=3037248 RepID=UPI00240D62F3|nr:glutathione S-transferase family protein [Stenotrophomonas sp. HITSZ_GD]MDG2525394.1 glutathione S-transferase family protein [Stenotrophomonas sp. HITSZ_GD]